MLKISKLANKIENKLAQQAKEVNSEDVTMAVRPTVNSIIESLANSLMSKVVMPVVQKKAAQSKAGGVSIGGNYFTNASKQGGKWKLEPGSRVNFNVTGDFAQDKDVLNAVKQVCDTLNKSITAALEKEFNRLSGTWENNCPGCNKITNHDSNVNNKNLEV